MIPPDLVGAPWRACGRDPRRGLDCWGVVVACVPGAPDYAANPDDAIALALAFGRGRRDPRWVRLETPRDGCVASMGGHERPATHAGVWWRGYVVHATRGSGVRADPEPDLAALGYPALKFFEWRGGDAG